MLILLIGPPCAGKQTVQDYLVQRHQFAPVRLAKASPGSVSGASTSKTLHFDDPLAFLDYATRRWQQHFVCTDLPLNRETVDAFLKRPWVLLIALEAPLMTRWHRQQARQDGNATLEEFIQLNDALLYATLSSPVNSTEPQDATATSGRMEEKRRERHRQASASSVSGASTIHLPYSHANLVLPPPVLQSARSEGMLAPPKDALAKSALAPLLRIAHLTLQTHWPTLDELYRYLDSMDLLDGERLRPGWDTYFMTLAGLASLRSNCMKRRVGCVLVSSFRVVSTGYNGTPRGMRNCNEGGCARCNGLLQTSARGQPNGRDTHIDDTDMSYQSIACGMALDECLCLHAEENALLEAGRDRAGAGTGGVLYCNTCPCLRCSVKIVQCGIREVVYSLSYSVDGKSAAIFREAGVRAVHHASLSPSLSLSLHPYNSIEHDANNSHCAMRVFDGNALTSLLGTSTGIQGQIKNVGPFTLSVLTNLTHGLFTMNASQPLGKVGWMGIGFGTTMSNSDMIIVWPNEDDTWTLSHRTADGHNTPTASSSADAQPAQLVPVSSLITNSSSGSFASYTFIRALDLTATSYSTTRTQHNTLARATGQDLIYAYSSSNPGTSDTLTPDLQQHDHGAYGSTQIDLSRAVVFAADGTTTATDTSGSEGDSAPYTRYDYLIIIHALCGGLAWLIISPTAVLVARTLRHLQGLWFKLHMLFQVILTLLLTIVAIALGAAAISSEGSDHFDSFHTRLGLIIGVLLLLQLALGWYTHANFDPLRTHRPAQNITHIFLGIILTIAGFVQIKTGFEIYDRSTPGYIYAIYYLVVAGFAAVYLISAGRLVQQRRDSGYRFSRAAFGLGRPSRVGGLSDDYDTKLVSIGKPRLDPYGHLNGSSQWGSTDTITHDSFSHLGQYTGSTRRTFQ
ncbi:uncharacterized protein L969DRAFT_95179 [Mixia osmundae IAM 14324]|uniref:Deoxycytidylate deaminase n=1 Tax=Mixia osmundae (strain CBS 9802 / IAM 14324 / JCM 22182 / KY 12970) TaxID=764103 RepID=G7E6X9_MIXOS|nr:uncharacterized protein L969DRAFT_95179 [Mixia osmundae IAM 14324]KEI39028.1 hypothetical protein L969DRAFT_95179 [Mixia osmundae IAM 14324]GAA98589.1 hypothetical protein E5Q_05276 [Mixia osmundae IAM 14324]